MLLELRIDTYRPRTLAAAEARYAAMIEQRTKISPLAGWWQTEVGPLNQALHLWTYKDTADRERALREEAKLEGWPPRTSEDMVEETSSLYTTARICPPIEPGVHGLYEFRFYTYPPDTIPVVMDRWEPALAARMAMAPLIAVGHSTVGRLNELLHIWAFRDAGERQRIRDLAVKEGIWPAKGSPAPLTMRNLIAMPTAFSPLR